MGYNESLALEGVSDLIYVLDFGRRIFKKARDEVHMHMRDILPDDREVDVVGAGLLLRLHGRRCDA